MRHERMVLVAVSTALALPGCATTATPALEGARDGVRAAEADPLVSLYALSHLETAERELEVAETASSPARRSQAAYLAATQAELARLVALIGTDHARMVATQGARERIEFAARLPAQPLPPP